MAEIEKIYVTYNDVHKLCQESAAEILANFKPHLMIAIGGGGYVPARILRYFLRQPGSPNIPIQAIGLSLYESLPETLAGTETPGVPEVPGTRVDDTRTTLEYAVKELEKDVEAARRRLGTDEKTHARHALSWLRLTAGHAYVAYPADEP
ncbi:hypothetical protein VdG1_03448 [Verticillium dahliae VDG1]|nr:hypothetical protein VdG1_03448 [Verticillium dahliae VDG1]